MYEYQYFKSYKNAPKKIQVQCDNFFKKLKTLRDRYLMTKSEEDGRILHAYYEKMHNSIIYKSEKYSPVYCQILADVM